MQQRSHVGAALHGCYADYAVMWMRVHLWPRLQVSYCCAVMWQHLASIIKKPHESVLFSDLLPQTLHPQTVPSNWQQLASNNHAHMLSFLQTLNP
jgi:hypothetical protein